ncbi:MAG: GNAT family N-acetyltransferase [Saprospiraceae bacterium]|nr:GNAT family N-acetyltransferase [Saprospiraceae bacterium]
MGPISHNFLQHAIRIPQGSPQMQVFEVPSIAYVDSGLSCDTFNIIFIKDENISFDALEKVIDYYRSKQLEYCIWLRDDRLSPNLSQHLQKLSIERQNQEVGMVLNLNQFHPISSVQHQNIKLAQSKVDLMACANVIAENWTPADQNVITYYQQTAESYLDSNIQFLAYYEDGKAVASVEVFPTNEKVVGLYGFATLENYRKKGIGSYLFSYALNFAKAKGYQEAVLQASEDGIGIYEKMGFKRKNIFFEYA